MGGAGSSQSPPAPAPAWCLPAATSLGALLCNQQLQCLNWCSCGVLPFPSLPRPRPRGCQTSCCSPSSASSPLTSLLGKQSPQLSQRLLDSAPQLLNRKTPHPERWSSPQSTPRMFPWASAQIWGHYVAAAEQAANLGPSTAPGPLRTLWLCGWDGEMRAVDLTCRHQLMGLPPAAL